MHMPLLNYLRFTQSFTAFCLFVAGSFCLADDKAAVSALIAIVESGKTDQAEQAASLFKSIPDDSNFKPVAAHALALVHIREHRFSEAWKAITPQWKEQETASDSIKLGKEKIMLWLRLESGAADKAEPQFRRLVMMTLADDSAGGEQRDSCGFIGGVMGMLKTDASSSCIPEPILDNAKEAVIAKIESKTAKTEMEEQLADANAWGAELSKLVSQFESAGATKAEELNKSNQAKFEQTKEEQSKLRDDFKAAGGGKHDLDDQRRKGVKDRNALEKNLQREIGNRPAQPVHPGPQPREPTEPKGAYETDPKTQQRKFVKPTDRELKKYNQELASYKTWPTKFAKFNADSASYPGRLQLWEQNVAALKTQFHAAKDSVASIERAMKEMQADINQGVGKELKEAGEEAKQLERLAAISNIAYRHFTTSEAKAKSLVRPSNFQLIDYESECRKMRKALQ